MTATGRAEKIFVRSFALLIFFSPSRLPRAEHFQGTGGPEDNVRIESANRGGDQDTLDIQDMKRHGLTR